MDHNWRNRPDDERGLRALLLPFLRFRQLDGFRRTALAGSVAIVVMSISSIPDFGWIEATQLLVAISCIRLIGRNVQLVPFASPFQDGTLLAVGGMWTAIVTLINSFDGAKASTSILILAGCAMLFLSGMLLRAEERSEWLEFE